MVQVTPVVTDFLFIQFNDPAWEQVSFQYIISGPGNQFARKGCFRGLLVQLRMNFLEAGKYILELKPENADSILFPFEKMKSEDPDILVLRN